MGPLACVALRGVCGWRRHRPRALLVVAAAAAAVGCSAKASPAPPLVVTLLVVSDPGVPLAGAKVLYGGKLVGATEVDGAAKLALAGSEGQSFDLLVQCPEGYKSPAAPVTVTLRHLAEENKSPSYRAACPPTVRTVVVGITADKGPNLPVLYLGSEVARTDVTGAAHVLLRIAPGESFSLTLSTAGKGAEALRPKDPVATFAVGDQDEVFVFNPHFTVERRVRLVSRPARPTEVSH
jgi:hypothetical protein